MQIGLALRYLVIGLAAFLVIAVACGDDDGGGPSDATPTPVVEPTAAGDDDESQVRYTIERFVFFLNQGRLDDLCTLYSDEVLAQIDCETIKAGALGFAELAGDAEIQARMPSFDSAEVSGEEATAKYVLCLDIGKGESCAANTVQLVKTDDGWKIAG